MGSPVTADNFTPVTPASPLCDGFRALLRTPALMQTFLAWLLDEEGNISEAALLTFSDKLTPIGMIVLWGSNTLPSDKWLVCNGQAVNRTLYATLFQRYSTTWGNGDGATTFNLPNLQDKVPMGAGSIVPMAGSVGSEFVTLTEANMPAHKHDVAILIPGHYGQDGTRDACDGGTNSTPLTSNTAIFPTGIQDSMGLPQVSETLVGGGEAFQVIPPARGLFFIIKVK